MHAPHLNQSAQSGTRAVQTETTGCCFAGFAVGIELSACDFDGGLQRHWDTPVQAWQGYENAWKMRSGSPHFQADLAIHDVICRPDDAKAESALYSLVVLLKTTKNYAGAAG